MRLQSTFQCLLLMLELGAAVPVNKIKPAGNYGPLRRHNDSVKTTVTPDGGIIDWIPLYSQVPNGDIASPPPLPENTLSTGNQTSFQPRAPLQAGDAELGPPGTVPVLRQTTMTPHVKAPPVDPEHMPDISDSDAGDHWYASSAQGVANYGGSASFSLYDAWTESSGDFSLLQSAVIRYNVPKPGDNSVLTTQTVEAGWINYPAQISPPHLFTFFTTNGYSAEGDNIGGWNRDVAGWVQVDTQIFPGTTFSPLSTFGGAQYDIKIQWLLQNGNWWLFVLDSWIGYYPASLFGAGTDASSSLQTEASQINYYGEIFNSEAQLTTTDMGSGNFPEAGWQQSAYIRNMVYTDTSSNDQPYDGSSGLVVSDASRYRMDTYFRSQTTWSSYMYLGGPGAGGVVGG